MLPRHELWSALVQWQAFDGLKLTVSNHRVDDELLELLAKDEVELAATFLSKHFIKAVGPVDTHQAHHGKEDAYAKSGTTFHVEGIELSGVIPSVSGLNEAQSIDGGVT